MKVWIVGLAVSGVFALGLVGIVGIGAAPVRGETQWRELYETTGLTWAQISTVCPTDGVTPCAGSIGTVDLTGWVWATSAQVLELLDDYQPALDTANPPYMAGPDQFGAGAGFLNDMRWTAYFSLTYFYSEVTYGWTASKDGDLPISGGASFAYPIIDGSIGIESGPDGADPNRGVFLWRIGTPAPPPETTTTTTATSPAPVPDPTTTTTLAASVPSPTTTTTSAPPEDDPTTTTTTTAAAPPLPAPVVDGTPPVITPQVVGTLGSNGWYVSNVAATWDVTDPESTVGSSDGCYQANFATDTAGTALQCTADSEGGSTSASVMIKRDATVPVVACPSVAPTFQLDQAGAIVTASVTDATSGPSAPTVGVGVNTSSPGSFHALFVGSDQAGNATSSQCPYTVVVTCGGLTPTILGTPGNDTIRGTSGRDIIHGLGGNDTIDGNGGDDVICGGAGNDDLDGDNGNDNIDGGPGRDTIRGGRGNDACTSGEVRMSSC